MKNNNKLLMIWVTLFSLILKPVFAVEESNKLELECQFNKDCSTYLTFSQKYKVNSKTPSTTLKAVSSWYGYFEKNNPMSPAIDKLTDDCPKFTLLNVTKIDDNPSNIIPNKIPIVGPKANTSKCPSFTDFINKVNIFIDIGERYIWLKLMEDYEVVRKYDFDGETKLTIESSEPDKILPIIYLALYKKRMLPLKKILIDPDIMLQKNLQREGIIYRHSTPEIETVLKELNRDNKTVSTQKNKAKGTVRVQIPGERLSYLNVPNIKLSYVNNSKSISLGFPKVLIKEAFKDNTQKELKSIFKKGTVFFDSDDLRFNSTHGEVNSLPENTITPNLMWCDDSRFHTHLESIGLRTPKKEDKKEGKTAVLFIPDYFKPFEKTLNKYKREKELVEKFMGLTQIGGALDSLDNLEDRYDKKITNNTMRFFNDGFFKDYINNILEDYQISEDELNSIKTKVKLLKNKSDFSELVPSLIELNEHVEFGKTFNRNLQHGGGVSKHGDHGYLIASIAGARCNEVGIRGVVPNLKVVPYNLYSIKSEAFFRDIGYPLKYKSRVLEDIVKKEECEKKTCVVNMSWDSSQTGTEKTNLFFKRLKDSKDKILAVVSAGLTESDGNPICDRVQNFRVPSCWSRILPNVLTVTGGFVTPGNIEKRQRLSEDAFGSSVDIVAPGVEVFSVGFDQSYTGKGSSLAVPFVSAVAAKIASVSGSYRPNMIADRIRYTVDLNRGLNDKDAKYGWLNAERAWSNLEQDVFNEGVGKIKIIKENDRPYPFIQVFNKYNRTPIKYINPRHIRRIFKNDRDSKTHFNYTIIYLSTDNPGNECKQKIIKNVFFLPPNAEGDGVLSEEEVGENYKLTDFFEFEFKVLKDTGENEVQSKEISLADISDLTRKMLDPICHQI